jgi:hypothetical protein
MQTCGRCGAEVSDPPETCWWCETSLCSPCWEALGHCGHPEADKANEDTGRASTWDERHRIVNRRPIAAPKGAPTDALTAPGNVRVLCANVVTEGGKWGHAHREGRPVKH